MPTYTEDRVEELLPEDLDSGFGTAEYFDYDDDDEESAMLSEDDAEFYDDDDDDDDEEFLDPITMGLGSALAGGVGLMAAPHVASVGSQVIRAGQAALGNLVGGSRKKGRPRVRVRDYGRGVSGTRSAVINTARGPVTARFSRRFVTSAQLRSALGAVRTDMSKLSSRVKSVEGRMGKLVDQTRKATATAIAGESAKRAREMRRLRKRLEKKIDDGQMMSLMFSFIKEDDTSGTSGTSSTQDLLPLLLLSGGGGGGDDNNMLMMMIAMNVL